MVRLECVPNVSEGRDRQVIDACVAAVATPGVRVLDTSSDADHNRTVLTLVGEGDALVRAVTALASAAVELLDVRRHRGVHPFLGILDVVPFVPLSTSRGPGTMSEAVRTARLAADSLAAIGLPVFLYGEAAASPERAMLAEHRRGGLKRLEGRMATGEWPPDRGPRRVHPTGGAVLVGARPPLVAFNLLLDTSDPGVAKRIAAALRESGGGLPGVRALGFFLERRGRAQVSVNLTDCERTSLLEVVNRVERLARAAGTGIVGSEIVGLAPRNAVGSASAEDLRLPELGARQFLETHLEEPVE